MIVLKQMNKLKNGLILLGLIAFTFTSCSKNETVVPDEDEPPQVVIKEPVKLTCDYFQEDRILENDPDRPVDYIVDCAIKLRESTLSIEAGTVIEFTENGSIEVEQFYESAALIAKGTADKPIIFRGTKQEKGHWQGIRISNDNNTNELDYVVIQDAGREEWGQGNPQGGLSLGRHGGGFGKVKLTNSQLINNRGYGLDSRIFARGSTIEHIIKNNTFKNNDHPVHASMYNLQFLDPSNDFNGNNIDEIHVVSGGNGTQTTTNDATWYNHEVPYIFSPGVVGLSSKITIEPGAVLKFPSAGKLVVDRTNYGNQGTGGGLIAKGTAEKPIVFTGIEPLPRYWAGININTQYAGNEISHAVIEYTGTVEGDKTHNLKLTTASGGATYLNIHNVAFRHSNVSKCAIILEANSMWGSYADIENITVDDGHCILEDQNPLYH